MLNDSWPSLKFVIVAALQDFEFFCFTFLQNFRHLPQTYTSSICLLTCFAVLSVRFSFSLSLYRFVCIIFLHMYIHTYLIYVQCICQFYIFTYRNWALSLKILRTSCRCMSFFGRTSSYNSMSLACKVGAKMTNHYTTERMYRIHRT